MPTVLCAVVMYFRIANCTAKEITLVQFPTEQAGGSEDGRSSGPLQLNGGGGGREVGAAPVLGGLQLQLQQLNKQVTTGWRRNVADS